MVEQDVAIGQRLVAALGNGVDGIVRVHEASHLPGFAGLEVQFQEETRRGCSCPVGPGIGVVVQVQDDLGFRHLGDASIVLVAETGVWSQVKVAAIFALRMVSFYHSGQL